MIIGKSVKTVHFFQCFLYFKIMTNIEMILRVESSDIWIVLLLLYFIRLFKHQNSIYFKISLSFFFQNSGHFLIEFKTLLKYCKNKLCSKIWHSTGLMIKLVLTSIFVSLFFKPFVTSGIELCKIMFWNLKPWVKVILNFEKLDNQIHLSGINLTWIRYLLFWYIFNGMVVIKSLEKQNKVSLSL